MGIHRTNFLFLSTSLKIAMLTKVIVTTLLLAAVQSAAQYDTCNIKFYGDWPCNKDNLCYYGCIKGSCWSQCNGAGGVTWDGPDGTCNTWYDLNNNIEWCWLKGASSKYQSCSKDTDCDGVKMNSCSGSCAVGTAFG